MKVCSPLILKFGAWTRWENFLLRNHVVFIWSYSIRPGRWGHFTPEETLRQRPAGGHCWVGCLSACDLWGGLEGCGWATNSVCFLWASAFSSVKLEVTVSKVPPWVSNTVWRICLVLEKDMPGMEEPYILHHFRWQGWGSYISPPLCWDAPVEKRRGRRALTGCLLVSPFGNESAPLFLFWAPESLFCKRAIPSLIALPQIGFLDLHDTQVTATSGSGYHFLWHPLHKASSAFFPQRFLTHILREQLALPGIKWVGEAEGTAENL